jgi:hypothetical protein
MGRKDSHYREYNFAVAWVSQPTLWSRRATRLLPCDVRFGSLADVGAGIGDVRFTPDSGRWAAHPSQHFGCAFMSTRPKELSPVRLHKRKMSSSHTSIFARIWVLAVDDKF